MPNTYVVQEFTPKPHVGDEEPSFRLRNPLSLGWDTWLAGKNAGDNVRVVIELEDDDTGFKTKLQTAADLNARNATIRARRADIRISQESLKTWLKSEGATIHGEFWSSNALDAEVPKSLISQLAARTEVIGVFPADLVLGHRGEPVNSGSPAAPRRGSSSYGDAWVTKYGGQTLVRTPSVTIMAPTMVRRYATGCKKSNPSCVPGANNSYSATDLSGTSAATGVMGGAIAVMLTRMRSLSLPTDYRVINALVGLMGDGASGTTSKIRTYVDDEYGFGRFKMQMPIAYPFSPGYIALNNFVMASSQLNAGQSFYLDIGCGNGCDTANGIKVSMFVEDRGRNSAWVPRFDLSVVDGCNSNALIKSAANYKYLWKRIRVFDTWRYQGKCPRIKVTLNDNATYQNIKFGLAAYVLDSNNPDWEWH